MRAQIIKWSAGNELTLYNRSWVGIVWDLAKPPRQIYAEASHAEKHFS
jgi:hypothetical protein